MLATHLRHLHLDIRRRLVRTGRRAVRPIRQTCDLLTEIANEPSVNGGAVNSEPFRDFGDISTRQRSSNRVQPLLDNRQGNEYQSRLLQSERPTEV